MDKATALLLLGLREEDLDRASLKAAYRTAMQVNHPDRHQGNEKLRKYAEEQCRRINEARETLERYLDREDRYRQASAQNTKAAAKEDGPSKTRNKSSSSGNAATGSARANPSSSPRESSARTANASKGPRTAPDGASGPSPNRTPNANASATRTAKEEQDARARAAKKQRGSRIAWNICAVVAVVSFLMASAPVSEVMWNEAVSRMDEKSEIAPFSYIARQDDLAVIMVTRGMKDALFVVRASDLGGADPGEIGYVGTRSGNLLLANPLKPCTFLFHRTYATALQYLLEGGGQVRSALSQGYLGEVYTNENYCFSMPFPGGPTESAYSVESEIYGTINSTRFFASEGDHMTMVEIQYGEEFLQTVRTKKQELKMDSFLTERVEACAASYAELLDMSSNWQIETGRIDGERASWAIIPSYATTTNDDGETIRRGARIYLYVECIATENRVYLLSGTSPTEELARISLDLFRMK